MSECTESNENPNVVEEGGSPERVAAAKRLQRQCWLTYNFDEFARYGKRIHGDFSHFTPIETVGGQGGPAQIVQKLLATPNLNALMHIKPYLLSGLVPQIRIFKVHYPSRESTGIPTEMPFEDYLSPTMLENITASGQKRGMGVGMKSFEWELMGTNPAESDNNIKAKLKMHFNSLEDFITPRARVGGSDVSYMNLIVPSPKHKFGGKGDEQCGDQTDENREYNNKYFRLKVSVGYGDPQGAIWDDVRHGAGLKNTIKNARQFLYLTLVSHSLEFREDGSLDVEIEYVAAMEGAMNHKKADVLRLAGNYATYENANTMADQLREELQNAVDAAGCEDDCDQTEAQEALDQHDEDEAKRRAEDKIEMYSQIMMALSEAGIYRIEVETDNMQFGESDDGVSRDPAEGPFGRGPRLELNTSDIQKLEAGDGILDLNADLGLDGVENDDAASEAVQGWLDSDESSPESDQVTFFYFGTLLDVALRCLYKDGISELAELKVITGPFVFFDPVSKRLKSDKNIADIPISMDLFNAWFIEKCISPMRDKWNLKQFIKDAVTGLVGAAMTPTCFGREYGNAPASLSLQLIQAPAGQEGLCRVSGEPLREGAISGGRVTIDDILPMPDVPNFEDQATAVMASYLYIYVSSTGAVGFGPPQSGDGTREERDNQLGVYHFRVGSDGGLMKKVKFKKSDQPYVREARMTSQDGNEDAFLREKYDADIEMFGNAMFYPGTHIYIDPSTVAAGDPTRIEQIAKRLGLGGYFLVTKVKCAIEAGKFSTDLETRWVASGNGIATQVECEEQEGPCGDDASAMSGTGMAP